MITVPHSSDRPQSAPQQGQQPSEAMMLMALAHMKTIGRIPEAQGKTEQLKGAEKGMEDRQQLFDVLRGLKGKEEKMPATTEGGA